MKQTNLIIPIDADKLEAIRQFTPPQKPDLETEIVELVDKIYGKTVPEPVRRFIEKRPYEAKAEPRSKQKKAKCDGEKEREETAQDDPGTEENYGLSS